MRALAIVALLASPALAQTPMTGAEFESYTAGKTLYFGQSGAPYGAEQYLPNRRVIWTFLDGRCEYGTWHSQGTQICFDYENRPGQTQCWTFFSDGDSLSARFENDPALQPLIEVEKTQAPLYCPGPDVGA
ncbi:hypothetical protein ATO10_00830 [Actibacterium atlanticum]|uniref:Uncharacterized protein n=1 Tax=Actibacterium atlanticum TaxID=1461693 RepID=A0A058ZR18_9RHOB|nr:hypothetical protein [Actibacterium atlanticum]KCV83261.1 hypothetical protein ATO10_00830 [Actibacterium atlanticum]